MMKMGTYNINEHFYVKDRKREISDKINDIKNSFLNTKLEKEEMGISAKDIMDEKDDMEIKSKRNYIFENKKIEDSMKNSVITSKTEFLLDKKGNSPENRIFDYHERWTVSLKKRFLVNRQIHEIKKYKINDKMFY